MDLIDDAFAELIENINDLGKSSQKLVILAYMLRDVKWNEVGKFAIQWESLEAGGVMPGGKHSKIPVPIMYLTMKNGDSKTMVTDEDHELLKKSVEDIENDAKRDEK